MKKKRWILFLMGLVGVPFLTAVLHCGGGGSGEGGGHPADLNGTYNLIYQKTGATWEESPIHISSTQTGTDLTWIVSCNQKIPQGSGAVSGDAFAVSFDFGGGNSMNFTGANNVDPISGTYIFSGSPDNGTFRLEAAPALNCANACDNVSVMKFVDTEFTELAKIERISLFRSGAGHDYSDRCETCRSMKHYYAPDNSFKINENVKVFSPVDGIIIAVNPEGHGASPPGENKQVHVRSNAHPEYKFILFHVDLAPGITLGKSLTKGEQVGFARMYYPDLSETADNFDIAVELQTPYGPRYVSYFDTMTDTMFNSYVTRGATSRSDFIISKATRDAAPLTCSGETFSGPETPSDWRSLARP